MLGLAAARSGDLAAASEHLETALAVAPPKEVRPAQGILGRVLAGLAQGSGIGIRNRDAGDRAIEMLKAAAGVPGSAEAGSFVPL